MLLALVLVHSRCDDGAGSPPAQTDAGAEALPGADAADAAAPGDAAADDGPNYDARWDGWIPMPGALSGCEIDVPTDVVSAVAALKMIPCDDGRPNCTQVDTTGWTDTGNIFTNGWASSDGDRFVIAHWLPGFGGLEIAVEIGVYDYPSLTAVAGWRSADAHCEVLPQPRAGGMLALRYQFSTDGGFWAGKAFSLASPTGAMTAPGYVQLLPEFTTFKGSEYIESQDMSSSTLAFALDQSHNIVIGKTGNPSYVRTSASSLRFTNVFVVGNDTFARNEYGIDGWDREVTVAPDGTTTVLRAVSQAHVDGFVTDGSYLYWNEASGDATPTNPQPNVVAYAAPFTTDAATLDATKKILFTSSSPPAKRSGYATKGLYVMQEQQGQLGRVIIRQKDGSHTLVGTAASNTAYCDYPLIVNEQEFWCIERRGPSGPLGIRLSRTQLGAW